MARVLITGSTDGIGRAAATVLQSDGHEVVVHARSQQRLAAVADLVDHGAGSVVGDLADLEQVLDLAEQAKAAGPFDAVIHNAGIIDGPGLLPVNVVAPYALTVLVPAPRVIYLSSSMHRGGRPDIPGADWSGSRTTASYSDSKLYITTFAAALARRQPGTVSHAVDPGWVPTKMGGPSASDDLDLGHQTQVWLATTNAPEALASGGYWHHRRTQQPHPAVHDERSQDELIDALAEHTSLELPTR